MGEIMSHALVRVIVAAGIVVPLSAQEKASSDQPRFEVASVRANRSEVNPFAGVRPLPGGRIEATNVTLHALIAYAYRLQLSQLPVQGKTELLAERFDVIAKAPGDQPLAGRRVHRRYTVVSGG
jgi:hypothetical protein